MNAFLALKEALVTPPILAYPRVNDPYILHTDASSTGIGAVLSQMQDGQERIIAYFSKQLSKTQRSWAAIERECFALVQALDRLQPYLWGAEFVIYTDHKPLTSLFRAEIRNTKIQRWAIQISEFGAPIRYKPGSKNISADLLSRISSVKRVSQSHERHEKLSADKQQNPGVQNKVVNARLINGEVEFPWHAFGLEQT